jgi:Cu-Zn family superoxide dismutase
VTAFAAAGTLAAAVAAWAQTGGAKATAQLQPTKGNTASGTVTFTQAGSKVLAEVKVSGLSPGAEHGFHIHEKGDCSSGDGMSTGGHFNPLSKPHAHFSTTDRHAGDMPALKADASGNSSVTVELDVITVTDGPTGVVGRGLIVHAQPDDYKTQPTGNAGARIACGVIQKN